MNAINWFEIAVSDYDRAKAFYEKVLNITIVPFEMSSDHQMGLFKSEAGGVGGAIMCGEGYTPSMDGALVYLNGGEDLLAPLSRVEAAGGKVILPKRSIGENGFVAFFSDTEGNRVALHSMN